MAIESPRIYLANMYTDIFSQRGIETMEKASLEISGNLLSGRYNQNLKSFNPDLIVYSPTPEDAESGFWEEIRKGQYPFILFSMFLDRDIGWNESEGYRYKPHKHFSEPLQSGKRIGQIFAASNHGAETILKTYKLSPNEVSFCYLGIDYYGINQIVKPKKENSRLSILWQHMWRTDKGFRQALDIVEQLSKKYPDTLFVINEKDSWRGNVEAISLLKKYFESFTNRTNNQKNIIFNNRFGSRYGYYSSMTTHDISFCTARIENFGLGMMEQSAAGIATIVPSEACYPEMYIKHICDLDKIESFIEVLIANPHLRQEVAKQRKEVAESFDVEKRIPEFISFIKQSVK
jgi:glycosyltransferase involved in cell wall biosynthesis